MPGRNAPPMPPHEPRSRVARSWTCDVWLVQAPYDVVSDMWPLVYLRSFEARTGPESDGWHVKTVGAPLTVVEAVLGVGGTRGRLHPRDEAARDRFRREFGDARRALREGRTVAQGERLGRALVVPVVHRTRVDSVVDVGDPDDRRAARLRS